MQVLRSSRSRAPAPARSQRDPSLDTSYSQETADGEDGVRPGLRVRHAVFGAGVVLAVTGSGLTQKLKIRFERAGVKTVMVRYANLELL